MRFAGFNQGIKKAFLCIMIFLPILLSAYRKDLIFTYLSVKEGLSQNNVTIILKDHKGYMWFATIDGLNRYDGRKFIIYRYQVDNPHSLSSNSISSLLEDDSGNLWVGTSGNGLNRLEKTGARFVHYRHDEKNPDSLSSDAIHALCQDANGYIWVATGRGLDRLDGENRHFSHFSPDHETLGNWSGTAVKFIQPDHKGTLWIGFSDSGLLRFDPDTMQFSRFRTDSTNEHSLFNDEVLSGCMTPDETIWIGHNHGGISRLDPKTGLFTREQLHDSSTRIGSLCADRQGNLWAGTDKGVFFFNPETGEQISIHANPRLPATLSNDSIASIYIDDTDILWVGGTSAGVNKCNLKAKRFVNYTHDPANPNTLGFDFIRGIYENSNGVVYIGGEGILDRYNPKTETWRHFTIETPPSLAALTQNIDSIFVRSGGPTVYHICPNSDDPEDLLWLGTNQGRLFVFDQKRLTLRPFPIPGFQGLDINRIYKFPDGILWICTNVGINQYNPKTHTNRYIDLWPFAAHNAPPETAVNVDTIIRDKNGIFWIGSRKHGLFSYNTRSEEWRNFPHDPDNPQSLSHDRIPAILESNSGKLWIGTYGGGLNRYDPKSDEFERFTTRRGLPNDVVYGMCEDENGDLWISTNMGLCRFDPRSGKFRSYTDKDGLIINEFNSQSYFRAKHSGRLYFGGIKGVTSFLPSEIQDDPHPPSVVIEDLKIFNRSVRPGPHSPLKKPIDETESLSLSYKDSMLTFELNGLHYVAPAKNRLAYLLEGFDQQWNRTDMQRSYATYTNLNPGHYILRVKAANCDGVWSKKEKQLKIYIAPPFWKTWWFLAISAILSILALITIYQTRVRALKKRKTELEGLVALRTQELREMSLRDPLTGLRNRRFITEVLKQDLNAFINSKQFLLNHKHRRNDSTKATVYGICMIDIDHFKAINDTHSHEVGDQYLQQLSDLLCDSIREDDVVVRMGGEEFLIVLKKTNPLYLNTFVKKLKDKIEAMEFSLERTPGVLLRKTVSIGFAVYPFYPESPELLSFDHLITLADLGMMHGKKVGRNIAVQVEPGNLPPQENEITPMLAALETGLLKEHIRITTIK